VDAGEGGVTGLLWAGPTHTTRLSRTLFRYLASGHYTDAVTVHGYAHHAARHSGDQIGQARALTGLGVAHGDVANTLVNGNV
jgi:hypothetical protein